ncbi:MAG: hypothetical protein AB1627_11425 [Chloroflexota bacterium]
MTTQRQEPSVNLVARPRILGQAALASLVVGAALVVPSAAFATQPAPDHKVTICHRTNSDTNPYVVIDVDIASSGHLQGGHDTQHEGPIWVLGLKDQHIEWGDIIPPYTYLEFSYPGQNWTAEGQATWADGCAMADPSEEPSEPAADPSEPAEEPSQPAEEQTPGGEVEGETGAPQVTPPATDTIAPASERTGDPSALLLALAALAIVGGLSADRARARR